MSVQISAKNGRRSTGLGLPEVPDPPEHYFDKIEDLRSDIERYKRQQQVQEEVDAYNANVQEATGKLGRVRAIANDRDYNSSIRNRASSIQNRIEGLSAISADQYTRPSDVPSFDSSLLSDLSDLLSQAKSFQQQRREAAIQRYNATVRELKDRLGWLRDVANDGSLSSELQSRAQTLVSKISDLELL